MGRYLGWALGLGFALAVSAAPASAQTRFDIGIFAPNIGVHVGVGRPVYAPPPVYYRAPIYRAPVYRPPYRPVYRNYGYPVYREVYRPRVVVVQPRYDRGRSNDWDNRGRGPSWSRDRDRDRDRDWDRRDGRRR